MAFGFGGDRVEESEDGDVGDEQVIGVRLHDEFGIAHFFGFLLLPVVIAGLGTSVFLQGWLNTLGIFVAFLLAGGELFFYRLVMEVGDWRGHERLRVGASRLWYLNWEVRWQEYRRDQIGSVHLAEGLLLVSDQSGNDLIKKKIVGSGRQLRRALERHSWIEPAGD